jgi:hypothetical protein
MVARPMSDLFGKSGRAWLGELELPSDERQTVDGCLRQIDFLDGELGILEKEIAGHALGSEDIQRLITVPGVSLITAATFIAAVGEIDRFPSPRKLVGYLGLDPKVRQSGREAARHGHISKQGAARARQMLTEAAFVAVGTPAPMRAFYERVRARRGSQIAVVAGARKLAVLFWHMLTREQDYSRARRSPATSPANSSCAPAPSATQAAAASSTGAATTSVPIANANASSPSTPSSPTAASSPTGKPRDQRTWVRARHRGAHLQGRLCGKQRGRPQAPATHALARRSPAPGPSLAKEVATGKAHLLFIRAQAA